VAGEGGLRLKHPAELVLRVRRSDRLLAEEFAAELTLAVAEQALEAYQARAELKDGEGAGNPGEGSPSIGSGSP
jgi:hypothetical protein